MSAWRRVSVLVPAFNEEELLGATLATAHASFRALGHADYEIVVCDNNSTDATAEIARIGGARVVFEPHNQMSRARNAAAHASTGEWLIFLDADTRLDAALLRATLDRLATDRVAGGGALIALDTDAPGWVGRVLQAGWNGLSRLRHLAPGLYIYCLRRGYEAIGGFDETAYYFEDVFFSRRLVGWARRERLTVSIIAEPRVVTSARKLRWYDGWQLLRQALMAFVPGSIHRRDAWRLWYTRPPRGTVRESVRQEPATDSRT